MSGDAGQDIANAYQKTQLDYGTDPRKDYIPPSNTDPLMAQKQSQKIQDWLGHLGAQAGQEAGIVDSYGVYGGAGDPNDVGGEGRALAGYDPATGLPPAQWLARRRRMLGQ
jgi:hypothetical protein